MTASVKKSSLHSCNILQVRPDSRQLWHFLAGNNRIELAQRQSLAPPAPLPQKLVTKTWRALWNRKVNVAWLPAEEVFLRVIHLPAASFAELSSMVELQLEKLSPIPVHQVLWTIELLPRQSDQLQSVVVIIASRPSVEAFLGTLESDGFQPDRLELPEIHQFLATKVDHDGVWIYPNPQQGKVLTLVAWWFNGVLQQLQLFHLPDSPEIASLLLEQLNKTAWAGEMEGWLTAAPRWHLVVEPSQTERWKSFLPEASAESISIVTPLTVDQLAELNARRVAYGETAFNLLPAERSARYRQQFADHLWMSGLGGLVLIYITGVLIYFAALQVLNFQHSRVESQVNALKTSYTNAVKLNEQIEVLQNQLNLKFAALDAFKAASDLLPTGLSLTKLNFQRGQKLLLEGNAPQGEYAKITDFNQDLRKATVEGKSLFAKVEEPKFRVFGQQIAWNFACDLK